MPLMSRRSLVEQAVSDSLRARNETQTADALVSFAEENWSVYSASSHDFTDRHADLEQAFEIVRSQRQIILAAIGELASHHIVEAMTERLDADGTLLEQPAHQSKLVEEECAEM